jgi:hypothetical protein
VSVAKLIGRCARRQSRLIHEGRRRLAEGMARYPRIARASERFPKIRLRIARVSPATEDRRKDGIGSRPCQQHLDAPRRESQRSLTSSGFSRLAGQTSTIKPDHGSVDGHSSVLKINVFPQKPSRFADAATGAKHERNKIGEVPAYRFVVVGEQGSKLLRLCHGQGTGRLGSSSADGPDVTDGISIKSVAPRSVRTHTVEDRPAHLCRRVSVMISNRSKETMNGSDRQFSHVQFPEARNDVSLGSVLIGKHRGW